MRKLTFINACLRGENSRTKRIADNIIAELSQRYIIDEIDLTNSQLKPLDSAAYAKREQGYHHPTAIDYAKRVAEADLIVAALPFWDMSFPSIFKVFCEQITINGITFHDSGTGDFSGGCKAKEILLVTTRGMDIEDDSPFEQGGSYLKAIGFLWGIPEVRTISAIGMDTVGKPQQEERILAAIEKGKLLCKDL